MSRALYRLSALWLAVVAVLWVIATNPQTDVYALLVAPGVMGLALGWALAPKGEKEPR